MSDPATPAQVDLDELGALASVGEACECAAAVPTAMLRALIAEVRAHREREAWWAAIEAWLAANPLFGVELFADDDGDLCAVISALDDSHVGDTSFFGTRDEAIKAVRHG